MHEIIELIKQHGDLFYLITFVWTALEGETFVLLAGLVAQRGLLNVWLLFPAAWLGSMCGDQIFFYLGRRFGTRLLKYLPRFHPQIDKALGALEQYAVVFILSYRFIYGIRNISGFAVGLSNLPWKKFTLWNAVASFIWASVFVGFGYFFGDAIGNLHHKESVVQDSVRQITLGVLALFVLLFLMKVAVRHWHRRSARKH